MADIIKKYSKYQEPKTESSKRTIRVNQDILNIISELKSNGYHKIFFELV
ncbi:hypothetical protein B808_227 [Fructilactobacillus florum 8D]|uniref:Uncharacterized protein n=1 Tax=Fructilactobacillus florum 8D TaxID=1221538 RepID=W9EFD7_9LACO|nr:hypothetical protein B808_227 [Fructilactobacillus florum 8D]